MKNQDLDKIEAAARERLSEFMEIKGTRHYRQYADIKIPTDKGIEENTTTLTLVDELRRLRRQYKFLKDLQDQIIVIVKPFRYMHQQCGFI